MLFQIVDNEPFFVRLNRAQIHQCCDCGMVHYLRYRRKGKRKLEIRMVRSDELSARVRRRKEFRGLQLPTKGA